MDFPFSGSPVSVRRPCQEVNKKVQKPIIHLAALFSEARSRHSDTIYFYPQAVLANASAARQLFRCLIQRKQRPHLLGVVSAMIGQRVCFLRQGLIEMGRFLPCSSNGVHTGCLRDGNIIWAVFSRIRACPNHAICIW